MAIERSSEDLSFGLTDAGRQRLAELREQTVIVACTSMADWLDAHYPVGGADARAVLDVAAELLRYPVLVDPMPGRSVTPATERVATLERLIRHGIEALRAGDGDAITARATLANLEQLALLAREADRG